MENLHEFFQTGGSKIDINTVSELFKNFIFAVAIILIFIIVSWYVISLFNDDQVAKNISTKPTAKPMVSPSNKLTKPGNTTAPVYTHNTAPTQQIYKKYDEITKPANISGPLGYIGRDFVCFREKSGDQAYINKRSGCMACQVDNRQNPQKYGQTQTNVISTCVYSDSIDPNDPSVWTKEKCISGCQKLQDVK